MKVGSAAELEVFGKLQSKMVELFHLLSNDRRGKQAVLVVPSLSMDPRELIKIEGSAHYEERMLVNLMLLRQPCTKLIYVTSQQLDPIVVDYYISLLSGVPRSHVRKRLVLLHCSDSRIIPLSQKILMRVRLRERITRELVGYEGRSHMMCFNSTPHERSLSVVLGLPLHSVDPALNYLGTKSGCRRVFRDAAVNFPFGFEDLKDENDIVKALAEIKNKDPAAQRAVIKLNEGFSGEGNALFYYPPGCDGVTRAEQEGIIRGHLPNLKCEAASEDWESFHAKFVEGEGVVESFVEGEVKNSPSVQCRVNAIGEAMVISTHDQVLGGPSGQVFLGCTFPAIDDYRLEIQDSGQQVAEALAAKGVLGRFGIDYVSVQREGKWEHNAIEVNLRKGGTTHPFLTLKFLTAGRYSTEDGLFYSPSGKPKYYYSTDTVQSEQYKGLLPEDLVDIAVYHGVHFHGPTERGVVFHIIGALSEYGKLGMVAIGDNPQQAKFLYNHTLQVLDEETGTA